MENTKNLLIRNMKEIREGLGISQDQLAEMTGYTRGFIADIERGKSWISAEALEKISEALKVDVARLFKGQSVKIETPVTMKRVASRIANVPENIWELIEKVGLEDKLVWEDVQAVMEVAIERVEAKRKNKKA